MLDANKGKLVKVGTLTIRPDGWIELGDDWEFANCSCREAAVLAALHGVETLGREVAKAIRRPGDNQIIV